jgi:hypothetical protein
VRICGLYNGIPVSPWSKTANDSERQLDHGEDVGVVKENLRKMRKRVLHPLKAVRDEVEVLRGLQEGSRLSPMFFVIFPADLIRELQVQFPDMKMPTTQTLAWMGTIFYVDD